MEKEIIEAIEKNLPAQTAGVLRDYLTRAKQYENTIKQQKEALQVRDEKLKARDKTIEDLSSLKLKAERLETKENELKERELRLEVQILEIKLGAEKDKSMFVQGLAMGLVRNTEYKKVLDVREYKTQVVPNGHYVSNVDESKGVTETTTEA